MSQTLIEPSTRHRSVHVDEADASVGEAPRTPRLKPKPSLLKRSSKVAMHWIRRGHLYFGLFLFPWALLYGVTAFLFNHPTAFSDQKSIAFERSSYLFNATEAAMPTPKSLAAEVIAKLNETQKPATPYELGEGEVRFNREFAFATFKSEKGSHNLLLDLLSGSGAIREQPAPRQSQENEKQERAPFAVGPTNGPPGGGRGGGGRAGGEGRAPSPNQRSRGERPAGIETALKSQVESAIPKICKSAGLACNEMVITSIPELSFPIKAGNETWVANYNPLNGAVTGRKPSEAAPSELSFRRFLLRLHTAHGYPSSGGVRWIWAVIVDVMAAIMCFWGVSGMLMWWQIKSTRVIGAATVIFGLLAAASLGVGMHFAMR